MSRQRSLRFRSLRFRVLVAAGVAVVLGLVSLAGLRNDVFHGYQLQLSDQLFPVGIADERVAVVAVDRDSIRDVGLPWPWPRRLQAKITSELSKLGADTIAFDVVFTLPTRDDAVLARAVEESGDVVLATLPDVKSVPGKRFFTATNLDPPVPAIARAAAGFGHTSVSADPDGVVRSLPLVLQTEDGDIHPSLSLAAMLKAESIDDVYTFRPDGLQVGDRFIPTGAKQTLDISFANDLREDVPGAPIISAIDVLNGDVARDDVEGKIVFVGVSEPSLRDSFLTPVAKAAEMPGVLVHANALNTMLTGSYIRPMSDDRTAIAAATLALIVGLVTLLVPVLVAPFALLATLGGYAFWTFAQFESGHLLDLLYPMLAAVLGFMAAVSVRYFTELRGRRRASMLFSQYVPKAVAYQLLDEGRIDETIHGERVALTVLFCDLRGFTAQSAQMEPTQVRDMLNVYYDETTKLVHQHGGTLLNFVGDEVFAVWGAPIPDPENPRRAVACARAFQDACGEMNRRLAESDLPSVRYGIGLHTGEVIAAHVGTEMRRQYTVLGDTVNCGSRLCTIAGQNEIVVSEETFQCLDPKPPSEVLPGVRLKGVGRDLIPHRLWPEELRDPTGRVRGKLEA